ncbi:hypothetical protein FS749_014597 [Ceratobasidium sp. UAMH 11750]|nr:hypothetical protein FS749_014597 [Ceratobasidium sp. UAMH 11750]
MYAALEKSGYVAHEVGAPRTWTNASDVEIWVRSCIENVLGRKVDIEGDLFQQGMDSLTAAILLRTIKGSMHIAAEPAVRAAEEKLERNAIFVHPTVRRLAGYLIQLYCGHPGNSASSSNRRTSIIEEVRSTIQTYGSDWSSRVKVLTSPTSKPIKESVVLTGGTGGLGCYLLASLLADDNVERIWVLNRKSQAGDMRVRERQKAAFEDKLLDTGLLDHPKLLMLEAALGSESLGLEQEIYKQIQSTVTAIIHNAWQVNFNLTLPSFAPSLKGTRNLLELAFSSTTPSGLPRFLFASSVSAVGFSHLNKSLKEEYLSLEHGVENIGYGRSKLVAEKLLESARASGLEACIVRLGQLTGDQTSGAWSINDWVPSMIASSVSVGCLPTTSADAAWIPLDIAARAIHEVCVDRSVNLPPVIHCSHPQPVRWSDMIELFAESLSSHTPNGTKLEIAPFGEWNEMVTRAASNFEGSEEQKYRRFPSTKIQDVFEGMIQSIHGVRSSDIGSHAEAGDTALLDMAEAQKLSHTLENAPKLGRVYVLRWVTYWERRGLFA